MNSKAIVISLSVFCVVLVAILTLKFSAAEPALIPNAEGSLPHRKEISRDELLALDSVPPPSTLKVVQEPRVFDKENHQLISSLVTIYEQSGKMITQVDAAKAVAFVHKQKGLKEDGFRQHYLQEEFEVLVLNKLLREVYVDVSLAGSTREIFIEHFIIALNFDGTLKPIITGKERFSSGQLSADYTSLKYESSRPDQDNQAESTLDDIGALKTTHMITIIDLLSNDIIAFPLPGNAMTFALNQKSHFENPATIGNHFAAYRFTNSNTIEFTRFYRDNSPMKPNNPQVSDKELWSYDIKTDKLTLLETIPFTQVTSTSTKQ